MFYPLKFEPVYKDYIWGGDAFKRFGRELPGTVIAESWDISCHKNGVSVVSNGNFKGLTLVRLLEKYGADVTGHKLAPGYLRKFPLLVKLIDANDRLSVQVHPDDEYAFRNENGELGKNEMWYIIDAKPGAKLIYDVMEEVTRESFARAVEQKRIGACLKEVEVFPGDTINIPAGLIHAIGEGILLAEIQQNSDTTYRVYDFDRVDANGNPRPLHIAKALDVIDFSSRGRKEKVQGLKADINWHDSIKYLISNSWFTVELLEINKGFRHDTLGDRFYIYTVVEGEGIIKNSIENVYINAGDSVLVPAGAGIYTVEGGFTALRAYVPLYKNELMDDLIKKGLSEEEIRNNIGGLELGSFKQAGKPAGEA